MYYIDSQFHDALNFLEFQHFLKNLLHSEHNTFNSLYQMPHYPFFSVIYRVNFMINKINMQ